MNVELPSGTVLAYDDSGPVADPDASLVVLSHGLLMDRTMFAPQVEALRATHRCLTWDERGHGETVDDGSPFSFWDSADDLVALLDALEVERAVLVGMSQGGFLSFAPRSPTPTVSRLWRCSAARPVSRTRRQRRLYAQIADDWAAGKVDEATLAFVASLISARASTTSRGSPPGGPSRPSGPRTPCTPC